MIPRIFRLGVVTCLTVVVMVVACSGGSEPALPAETVAVGTTTQPANTLVSAPTAIPGPTTELTNGKADAGSTPGDFASISAGFVHTCGVGTDGSVSCWGANNYGESTPPDGEFASVSAGAGYTCGVRTDGSVACWGDDENGEATPPEGEFASVSAGNPGACGVRARRVCGLLGR